VLWSGQRNPASDEFSMRTPLAIASLLLLCACANPTVRVYTAYMDILPDGNAGLEDLAATNNANGIRSDLTDEFNLGNGNTPYIRLDLDADRWKIELSGFQYKQGARSKLAASYGDIPAGRLVDTELKVSNLKLGVLTDLVDLGPVTVSGGLAFNYFDVGMNVTELEPRGPLNQTGFENSEFQAPVPMLYLRGVVDTGVVRGELSMAWLEAKVADVDGLFLDIDAMLVMSPMPAFDIFAGYRYINIDVDGRLDEQLFTTKLDLSGWYLGVGITF
jgi:hypothetical protein